MYTYFYNQQTKEWNVSKDRKYICSFPSEEQATTFCEYANMEVCHAI
jgi:hypothetical protein